MTKGQLKRLLIAIAAWPAGMLAALLLLIVPALFGGSTCSAEGACAVELESASSTRFVLWLAVAFGPGIVATRAWWKGRGQP